MLFVGNTDIDYWDTRADYPGAYNVGGEYTCEDVDKEIPSRNFAGPQWANVENQCHAHMR